MKPIDGENQATLVKVFEDIIATVKAGRMYQFSMVYQCHCDDPDCKTLHNREAFYCDFTTDPTALPLLLGCLSMHSSTLQVSAQHTQMAIQFQKAIAQAEANGIAASGKH